MPHNTFYCFHCGEEIPNIAKFCPKCGTKFDVYSAGNREMIKNENENKEQKVANDHKEDASSDSDSNNILNVKSNDGSLLGNTVVLLIATSMAVLSFLMFEHGIYLLTGYSFIGYRANSVMLYLFLSIPLLAIDVLLHYIWSEYPSILSDLID